MRRIIITASLIMLTIASPIAIGLKTYSQVTPETLIGHVTYVDLTMIRMTEDSTQWTYSLSASPDKLRGIQPGYRVEVKAQDGRALSITVLGKPMKATPEPSQKWKVKTPAK
ncbi:MAG: hypothetical protein L0Y62_05685 [Nitrospirae bacterium]|nr:hypothetical protein [Nitrospirota bacterium]